MASSSSSSSSSGGGQLSARTEELISCDREFLFACVAAALAASRDHDLTISCLEEAFARCENGKTLKSPRVSRTIERILQSISDPTSRDVDAMRTFFVTAGLGFAEATRCANVCVQQSIPSPMKLALLVARQGSVCLEILGLSEEDESLILLAIRTGYSSPAARRLSSRGSASGRQGEDAPGSRGLSALWQRGGEDDGEEEEEVEGEEEGEEGPSPRLSPGALGSDKRSSGTLSALPEAPRERLNSSNSEFSDHSVNSANAAHTPAPRIASPNTSGDGATMPLSAMCSALKARLTLSPSLGISDTVAEACRRLSVTR